MAIPKKAGTIGAAALAIISATIALEGGYVNHPRDPGGETNMGVTKKVAIQHGYTGPMRSLPREIAEGIYYDSYIVAPGYAPLIPIDAAVTEELFDTAVNMGPPRPSRWFQQSINDLDGAKLAVDGKVGPGTVTAYRRYQSHVGPSIACRRMLDALDARQLAEYKRLVSINADNRAFYNGWVAHRIGNVDRRKCAVPVT